MMRALAGRGYKNIITAEIDELDLRRQKDTEDFFAKKRPEYVFLAAAKVGGILANSTYTAEFIYDNLMIAANIINSSYKSGVKKLLNLGSSCIYPRLCPQPMKEEYLLTGKLEPTNEPYAVAKISAIKLCHYYCRQYGADFISVMPTNLYGPGDNFNLETGHLPAALIRKFYLAERLAAEDFSSIKKDILAYKLGFKLDGKAALQSKSSIVSCLRKLGIDRDRVTLWGSGKVYREFLFVDDLARAGVFLMEKYCHEDIGEFLNIGLGKDTTIRRLAEIIRKIVGFKGEIAWDCSKPDGMPKKLLDISRIKKLGWRPSLTLEQGFTKTIEWFKSAHAPQG
jgi:GDP-L-fucose synthase